MNNRISYYLPNKAYRINFLSALTYAQKFLSGEAHPILWTVEATWNKHRGEGRYIIRKIRITYSNGSTELYGLTVDPIIDEFGMPSSGKGLMNLFDSEGICYVIPIESVLSAMGVSKCAMFSVTKEEIDEFQAGWGRSDPYQYLFKG